jgi:chitinase
MHQLSWNYNYGQAGEALGVDLLNNPDLVASDTKISFETALWFWMTPQSPNKPSCHAVMTGQWSPSAADLAAERVPGYGVTINGGRECGSGYNDYVANRIGFYMRYCQLLGVSYGDNLDCYKQTPYAPGSTVSAKTTAAPALYVDA